MDLLLNGYNKKYFKGVINELRFYNRVLLENEILSLYEDIY